MCLILMTFSLFLPISVSHFIVCSSIDTPLEVFEPFPSFYYFLPCIHRFLDKIRIHTWVFGQNSRINESFGKKSTYTCRFLDKSHVHPHFWLSLMLWEVVGWVLSVVGSPWVVMVSVGCLFCDQRPLFHWFFSLKLVLVIYLSVFPLVHYSFCLGVFLGFCFILAAETESFKWLLLHFSFFYIEKYKIVAY